MYKGEVYLLFVTNDTEIFVLHSEPPGPPVADREIQVFAFNYVKQIFFSVQNYEEELGKYVCPNMMCFMLDKIENKNKKDMYARSTKLPTKRDQN